MRPKPLAALLAVALVAVTAAAEAAAVGTGTRGGFAPVEPQSVNVSRIEDVYWFIMAFAVFVFLLVTIPLLVFAFRFRSNGRPRHVEGPQIRGNTGFELAWTALPVVILVIAAGYVFYKVPGIVDPAGAGAEAGFVRVEGRQFYWQYEYPNGLIGVNELRLPAERTTTLRLTAPEADVIHSFWAPALMGKRDTIPGQLTRVRVLPTRPGTYRVYCGEFCGLQHTAMLGSVVVMPPEEFDTWVEEQLETQRAQPVGLGGALWTGSCARCHDPELDLAPPLEGNPILNDARAVELVVRQGRGAMPAVGYGWSEFQMDAMQQFLETALAPAQDGGGDE